MRSDKQLGDSVVTAPAWQRDPVTGEFSKKLNRFETASLDRGKMSFSGNERNHLFLNEGGHKFNDVSGVSGLDSQLDSRSFVIWDFDRDGWCDIALASINAPVLQFFRNQMGELTDRKTKKGNMLAIRFIGGNDSGKTSSEFGCRDGIGAKATVSLSGELRVGELRCGEGLGAQNSSFLHFGIGEHEMAESISIQWPSGVSQKIESVAAGDLITVYENSAQSPDGTGFQRSRYVVPTKNVPTRSVKAANE